MRDKAQGTIEYFIIFTVVLAVIVASGIVTRKDNRVRLAWKGYFEAAAGAMR
jgi:hypothetical protein